MEDEAPPQPRRFKEGNDDGQGSYKVGKGRPPEGAKFKVGDGRPRGRRAKGTRNFQTDFQEEVERKVPVRENGAERLVSKQRAAIIRLLDNAYAKGQTPALALVFEYLAALDEKRSQTSGLSRSDDTLIEAWLAQRVASFSGDIEPDDPLSPESSAGSALSDSANAPDDVP